MGRIGSLRVDIFGVGRSDYAFLRRSCSRITALDNSRGSCSHPSLLFTVAIAYERDEKTRDFLLILLGNSPMVTQRRNEMSESWTREIGPVGLETLSGEGHVAITAAEGYTSPDDQRLALGQALTSSAVERSLLVELLSHELEHVSVHKDDSGIKQEPGQGSVGEVAPTRPTLPCEWKACSREKRKDNKPGRRARGAALQHCPQNHGLRRLAVVSSNEVCRKYPVT